MANPYVCFYLDGRDEKLFRHEIDEEKLAEQALEGADLRAISLKAATDAAKPLETSRKKASWLAENAEAITEAGGDKGEGIPDLLQGTYRRRRHLRRGWSARGDGASPVR